MIVYEVTLTVQRAIEPAFREWLGPHVREIVALPGFLGAQVYELAATPGADEAVVFCTQYRLADQESLDAYLREHAPRMRQDGIARFGDGFRAERRVLRLTQAY